MEHLPDDSPRYYDRHNSTDLINSFENLFIGDILITAADHLANQADLDLSELIDLQQPLEWAMNRPDADGLHEYRFVIALAEDFPQAAIRGCPFEFTLVHNQSDVVTVTSLSPLQKSHLQKQILDTEDTDENILEAFSPHATKALQDSVVCTQQLCTRYVCSQANNTITKIVTANYYIGDVELTSLEFGLGVVGEPDEQSDTADLTMNPFILAESGSDLAVIQPADMLDLYEILYYLNLPGGVIATEVTADYIGDDDRIVREL